MQYEFGCTPVEHVDIPTNSRDELPPVLRALQHIYCTPELNKQVFDLLEQKVTATVKHKHTGRPGMTLWEILVFGTVRLARDADYDHLLYIANQDRLIRSLVGLCDFSGRPKIYSLQTLKDNLHLIDEETIKEINKLVVTEGHRLLKVDEVDVKMDSYVLESNVHFPTDLNLLWDACRKCLELVKQIVGDGGQYCGFRKNRSWRRRLKRAFRKASKLALGRGKKNSDQLTAAVSEYLELAEELSTKLKNGQDELDKLARTSDQKKYAFKELLYFKKKLDKHIDLVRRRLIYKETIPHHEKDFSLFEPWTRWVNKGKNGNQPELGLPIVVATDQHRFILAHEVMEKESDVDLTVPMVESLLQEGFNVRSTSFDKNFWSQPNYKELKARIKTVVLPKKGRLTIEESEREHQTEFLALRKRHSAVESDINCLEHHGLNRCPDKGLANFRKYAALGVLSYNLHKLGDVLLAQDRQALSKKRPLRKAA
jgi:hypothetical protein